MINSLDIYDNLAIILYFSIVLLIGIYYSIREKQSADDYFLANRNMGWIVIGFSLFATNISSEHIIGLSGSGAERGLAVGHFEWLAILFILILGYFFSPFFLKANVKTIPEFIGQKFGVKTRKLFSGLSIFTYIFTKIAITLLAGGILLKEILGWDFFTSGVIMLLFTGLYTIIGGLRSVMYTQVFQTIIFLIGGILVLFFGVKAVGGFSTLIETIPADHLELFKPISDPDFPWLGILVGAPIIAAWYWWADQYIVQRILSARNIDHAKKGTLLGAGLKMFPFFLFIFAGMAAITLFPGVEGNKVYAKLLTAEIFPIGVKGLIVSGFFAALMSSLASAFNSIATLVAYDFYKVNNESQTTDEQLILVGRLATIILVIASIVFVPVLGIFSSGIYVNLQSLQAFISPPIVVVFLFTFFWKSANANAALWTLIIGETIGIGRILIEFFMRSEINPNGILTQLLSLNYLYFAAILFVVSTSLFVALTFYFNKKSAFNVMHNLNNITEINSNTIN